MDTQEFKALAESGQLTIGQALDAVMTTSKSAGPPQIKNAIAAGKMGEGITLDTPLKEAFFSDEFRRSIDQSAAGGPNYYKSFTTFETQLEGKYTLAGVNYLDATGLTKNLGGEGGLLKKGQLTGGQSRRQQPMQGLILSRDLDQAYADGFQAMAQINTKTGNPNVDLETRRFIWFHKHTVARVRTMLGYTDKGRVFPPLTLNDIVIGEDPNTGEKTFKIKGSDRVNKKRLPVTYRGAMAAFLIDQYEMAMARSGGKKLSEIKLFDTTVNKVDSAHNRYIRPIVEERFPTAVPRDSKGNLAYSTTAVRSAIQEQLISEFGVNPQLKEDFVGHETSDAYLASGASREGTHIGEVSESLIRQNAKNIEGVTSVNGLVGASNMLYDEKDAINSFTSKGSTSFSALETDYRGQKLGADDGRKLTDEEIDAIRAKAEQSAAASRLQAAEDTAKAIDIEAGIDLEQARLAEQKKEELKGIRQEVQKENKEKKLSSNMDFLRNNINKFKPIAKVIAPPVGYGLAAISADQTRSAVVNSALADQARRLGIPEGAIQTAGAVAGATEFLPVTPTDVIGVAKSIPTEPSMMQEARMRQESRQFDFGDEFGNIDPDTGQSIPTASPQTNGDIPNITITLDDLPENRQQPYLEAMGFAQRRNEARAAAMKGEETPLSQSFLYGGIVR